MQLQISCALQKQRGEMHENKGRALLQVEVDESGGAQGQHFQLGAGAQRQVRHGRHMHLRRLQAVAVLNLHVTENSDSVKTSIIVSHQARDSETSTGKSPGLTGPVICPSKSSITS